MRACIIVYDVRLSVSSYYDFERISFEWVYLICKYFSELSPKSNEKHASFRIWIMNWISLNNNSLQTSYFPYIRTSIRHLHHMSLNLISVNYENYIYKPMSCLLFCQCDDGKAKCTEYYYAKLTVLWQQQFATLP